MKKTMAIACLGMFLAACANQGPVRPASGPGSGAGAAYVPMIDPPPPRTEAYDRLVAKCQHEAAGLPFVKTENHDVALLVVDTAVAASLGYWAYTAAPSVAAAAKYQPEISAAIVSGTTFKGMRYLFDDWVYSPQVAVWHKKQETQIANCMARSGFANADPTVAVTWAPYSASHVALRATGKDTYTAEKLAQSAACAVNPIAKLVSKGPGYENHSVACSNGTVMVIHCEFGYCRVNERVASN